MSILLPISFATLNCGRSLRMSASASCSSAVTARLRYTIFRFASATITFAMIESVASDLASSTDRGRLFHILGKLLGVKIGRVQGSAGDQRDGHKVHSRTDGTSCDT